MIDLSIDSSEITDFVDKKFYKNSIGPVVYSGYSTLNDLQKKIYNAVVDAGIGVMTIQMNFEVNEFSTSDFTQTFFTEISEALALDKPQIFYYAGYSINNAYTYSNKPCIAKFNFNVLMYSNVTYSTNNLPTYYNNMMNVMQNASVDTGNRYNFVKSVHDYLCNIGTYPDLNSTDYSGNSHDAYGCLVERKPVCQGYSDAFKLFCDYYKVPCVCISGTGNGGGHMWNAVQMDDGNWYLIDITWDDQERWGIFYDFFLSGTDTVCSGSFGSTAFNESHVNDAALRLPVLNYAAEKYAEINHNTGFKATYNSLVRDGNYLIRSVFDAKESLVYYNGMYVNAENLTTNGAFTVSNNSGGVTEDWTMVLLGDCTGDGECDVSDLTEAVNKALTVDSVETAFDMAADADCDGYIDVIDVSIIERAVTGQKTDIKVE